MAMSATSFRSPLCLSCMRRVVGDDLTQSWYPFHRQLRGKKKTAKRPTTIKVKLLEDIKGYGRKGSMTPVEPGRMRNTWYPRQKAAYVTMARGIKPQTLTAERDFTFGMKPKEQPAPEKTEVEKPVDVQPKLLMPERASEVMEASIPSHLIFYRTPIVNPEPETPAKEAPIRTRRAASSAAAELEAASEPLPKPLKPQLTTIFGSVSTADIAESIKAVLAQTREGARVVLGPEDITILETRLEDEGFEETGVEGNRLKALGDFQVEAQVKGGEAVVRTVSVRAQEVDQ